jgi:hypothetical protein
MGETLYAVVLFCCEGDGGAGACRSRIGSRFRNRGFEHYRLSDRASTDGESDQEPTVDSRPSGRVGRHPELREPGRVDVAEGAMVCGRAAWALDSWPSRRAEDQR